MRANRSRVARIPGPLCLGVVLLSLGGVALLFASTAAAAYPNAAPPVAVPRSAPADAFTYAIGSDAATLDPSQATDATSFLLARQVYDTLLDYEPGGTLPVPGLAESWSTSPDGRVWTFTLRRGVRFHDGSALDAQAVLFNLERWWDAGHPYHDGAFEYFEAMFGGFKGDPECLITALAAVGTHQVQITLRQPHSPLLNTLAMPSFALASPAAVRSGTLGTAPVGSGPFRFVEWAPGDHIRLERNPDYRGTGPYLASLTFRVITLSADRLSALQAGTVQGTQDLGSGEVLAAGLDPNLKVVWRTSLNTFYLGINRAHAPLNEPLVDQAVAHALDKASIVAEHYNAEVDAAVVATQLLPPAAWGRDEELVDYAYSPTESLSLLAQAGHPGGVSTKLWVMPVARFYVPDPAGTAAALQADLLAGGISVTLVYTYDWPTYLQKLRAGEGDLFMLGWGGDNGHPDNFFYPLLCDGYLRYGPRDDVLCAHLDAARQEHDPETLQAMYEWAGQRVHATLPLVPIAHMRHALALNRAVGGLVPQPLGAESFAGVFLAAEEEEVTPEAGATLRYTDGQGSSTVVQVPPGAVSETLDLLFTPLDEVSAPLPGRRPAAHAFVLEAQRQGEVLPGYPFGKPMTLTVDYTDADVKGLREGTLGLYVWDGGAWSAAGLEVVQRDLEGNRLAVAASRLGEFGLFAAPSSIYLPLVLKDR